VVMGDRAMDLVVPTGTTRRGLGDIDPARYNAQLTRHV
jgi:hypothetical protein